MAFARRDFLKAGAAGALASQGLLSAGAAFAKPSGQPIVIGHQCDLTGGFSSWGYWGDKAGKTPVSYLNENDGIAGRPVQYVAEDTESKPPTRAPKIRSPRQRNPAALV